MNLFKAVLPVVALFLSSQAEARCVVPIIRTLENQTTQGTIYADSGKRCGISIAYSPGPMSVTRIVSAAAHGKVAVRGQSVGYTSKAGYTGEDHFTYARSGLDVLNHPTTRTVEITVVVSASSVSPRSGKLR